MGVRTLGMCESHGQATRARGSPAEAAGWAAGETWETFYICHSHTHYIPVKRIIREPSVELFYFSAFVKKALTAGSDGSAGALVPRGRRASWGLETQFMR